MTDRTLLCGDCGKEFVFTAAEQEFFRDRGFDHEPKRCVECRRQRRRKFRSRGPRAAGESGDSPPSPRPERRERAPPAPRELHAAVCSSCGAETQVPFEPDGVRPVYCMPCLKQQTR